MTTEAYRAALKKLETIKEYVNGIDFDYDRLEFLRDAEESLKQVQEDLEDELLEKKTILSQLELAQASVLAVEYRSGWSDDKEDLAVTEVRLTLAIGGPSIYLYADYDDGQVSNCRLVCNWWGDNAEITHDQDVMIRFIEYVNA